MSALLHCSGDMYEALPLGAARAGLPAERRLHDPEIDDLDRAVVADQDIDGDTSRCTMPSGRLSLPRRSWA